MKFGRLVSPFILFSGILSAETQDYPWLSTVHSPISPHAREVRQITIKDDRLYFGTIFTFSIFDISDPSVVTLLSSDSLGVMTSFALLPSSHVVTPAFDYYYDVSDPNVISYPELDVSSGSTRNFFDIIKRFDNLLFAQGYGTSLTIFDISEPLNPRQVSTGDDEETGLENYRDFTARKIIFENDLIFMIGPDDDDRALVILRYEETNAPGEPLAVQTTFAFKELIYDATDIAALGSTLYLAEPGFPLKIYNATDPENPQLLDNDAVPNARTLHLEGNLLFVGESFGNFVIYDVTTPTAPSRLGSVSLSGEISAIDVDDNAAFVFSSGDGLVRIDISDLSSPTVTEQFDIEGHRVSAVYPNGGQAYVLGERGMNLLDISDPKAPIHSNQLHGGTFHLSAAFDGTMAAAKWEHFSTAHFYDISDTPTLLRTQNFRDLRSCDLHNGLFFSGKSTGGLEIYEVNAQGTAELVGTWANDLTSSINEVIAKENFVILATSVLPDIGPNLIILDVSNPNVPSLVSELSTESVHAMGIRNNKLYLASFEKLTIVDINDLAHPQILSELPLSDINHPNQIALSDDLAFLQTIDGSVLAFDILDPTDPSLITADIGIPKVRHVSIQDDYLYLSRNFLGLTVIDISRPTPTLTFSKSPFQLSWDAPTGLRFPVESSSTLNDDWNQEGRISADQLPALLETEEQTRFFRMGSQE